MNKRVHMHTHTLSLSLSLSLSLLHNSFETPREIIKAKDAQIKPTSLLLKHTRSIHIIFRYEADTS